MMESHSKKKSLKRSEISVTKIYDHVKSSKFLEQLALECIQDVKQKPAYFKLKEMIERLLSKTIVDAGNRSISHMDKDNGDEMNSLRLQVAECGMLAYTIDSVVAEVVSSKLKQEFYAMVRDIVKEIISEDLSSEEDGKSEIATVKSSSSDKSPLNDNINGEGSSPKNTTNPNSKSNIMTRSKQTKTPSKIRKKIIASQNQVNIKEVNKGIEKDLECIKKNLPEIKQSTPKIEVKEKNENKTSENQINCLSNAPYNTSSINKSKNKDASTDENVINIATIDNAKNFDKNINDKKESHTNINKIKSSKKNVIDMQSAKNNIHVNESAKNNTHVDESAKNNTQVDQSAKNNTHVDQSAKNNGIKSLSLEKEKKNDNKKEKTSKQNEKQKNDSNSSEIESDWSMGSVSPVHTSELSSFDDHISLSSGDESGIEKKRISLKDANEIFMNGKLPELYKKKKQSKPKKIKTPEPIKIDDSSSDEEEIIIRKSLPQRIRKPNSKYISDNIFCSLKINSKSNDEYEKNLTEGKNKEKSFNIINDKNSTIDKKSENKISIESDRKNEPQSSNDTSLSSFDCSIKKKSDKVDKNSSLDMKTEIGFRKRGRPKKEQLKEVTSAVQSPKLFEILTEGTATDMPAKKIKPNPIESSKLSDASPNKNDSQRYDSQDLYKPRPMIPSFSSRGSRVITLCSTD